MYSGDYTAGCIISAATKLNERILPTQYIWSLNCSSRCTLVLYSVHIVYTAS